MRTHLTAELWKPWNNEFPESKILGLPVPRRMRALVYMASNLVSRAHVPFGQHQDTELRVLVLTKKHVGSALSVLVMLVSRNVFHVVSALQSFAFIHFILAYQISCRSYVGSVYRMRSLAAAVNLLIWERDCMASRDTVDVDASHRGI